MPKLPGIDTSGVAIGVMQDLTGLVAPRCFLLTDGKTIGNASSGATSRSNADTWKLFEYLYNNISDSEAPVSGGRGLYALADFNANKTITLPDTRGRTIIGKDNMGGSTAGRITAAGAGITGTLLGASGGTQTHSLTTGQMDHSHTYGGTTSAPNGGQSVGVQGGDDDGYNHTHTYSGTTASVSNTSASAHQNTQPSYVATRIIAYK